MKVSSYEQKIINLLNNANIPFKKEYVIKDLKNGLMRFDFYLPTFNCFLEANGMQHYLISKKHRTEDLKAHERDRIKINYCLAKNYKLYCIPAWEFIKINKYTDLFKEEYIAKSMYHNDEVYRQYLKNKK